MIYYFVRFAFRLVLKIFFRFDVQGLENVPRDGGFIIASNHASHLDPPILGCALNRPIGFMAKKELFEGAFWGWLLPRLHAMPVKRGAFDIKALRRTIATLSRGEGLTVFPEGTRSLDGKLRPPEKGVGFLVAKSGVPVVPAYIDGSYRAFPKGAKRLKLSPIRVRIGKPLYFGEQAGSAGSKAEGGYLAISQAIMTQIAELREGFISEEV